MKALWQFFGLSERSNGDDLLDDGAPVEPRGTVIGPGVAVKGELRGEGALTMLGQFEGEVRIDTGRLCTIGWTSADLRVVTRPWT